MLRTTLPLIVLFFFWLAATSSGEEGTKFSIQSQESSFTVKVGRAGLLKLLGHDHVVEVRRLKGEVIWRPSSPEASSVQLEIETASLTVADEGITEEERAEIQTVMEAQVLEVDKYPDIRFQSEKLRLDGKDGETYRVKLSGDLTLQGVTESVEIPLLLDVDDRRLRVRGSLKLKGSRFGIEPVRVAGGTVKTKDELELVFDLVGITY